MKEWIVKEKELRNKQK